MRRLGPGAVDPCTALSSWLDETAPGPEAQGCAKAEDGKLTEKVSAKQHCISWGSGEQIL